MTKLPLTSKKAKEAAGVSNKARDHHNNAAAPQSTNNQQRQPLQPLQRTNMAAQPPIQSPDPVASLGIAPRYTMTTDFNHVPYEAMIAQKKNKDPTSAVRPIKASRLEIASLTDIDKYASMSDESASENSSNLANIRKERAHLRSELLKMGGLGTIEEDGAHRKGPGGVTQVKKGLKKLFKRSTLASI